MHVDDHVHAETPCPVHDLREPVDVVLAELPAHGLKEAPGKRQAKRVETQRRHLGEV